jgi:hypothetical protein
MTMPTRLLGVLVVTATAASLVSPGLAGAKTPPKAGERTYEQTYPLASRLCTEVAAGKRKHLKPFAATILADCTALQSGFTAAQSAVVTTRATLKAQIAADRTSLAAACPKPAKTTACRTNRFKTGVAINVVRHQLIAAVHHYYRTIEANRRAFWAAIRALPGESHVHADPPVVLQDS